MDRKMVRWWSELVLVVHSGVMVQGLEDRTSKDKLQIHNQDLGLDCHKLQ